MSDATNSDVESAADDPLEILLVEDNPGDVRLVQEAVETTDHDTTVNVETTGDAAVESLLQSSPDNSWPDLMLLDLNLPGRDGCAVLDAIRDDSAIQTLPVLILSSSSSDDDISRCYEAKANAYLTKPDTLPELTSMMESVEDFWFENAHLPSVQA